VRLRWIVGLAALFTACDDSLEPPLVLEPAEGAVVDRALIRVRTSSPDDLYSGGVGTGEFNTAIGKHVNWRLDGGAITEVQFPTIDRDDLAPFLFGAKLATGTNRLEIGACDSFDACGWTERVLTFEPRSGSPDPAFAGAGQLLLADYDRVGYPTPLADGRVLVGIEDQSAGALLLALRANGTPDPTFGEDGVALLPANLGPAFRVLPQPSGGFLVCLADRLVHLTAAGARDPSFGVDGMVTFTAPSGMVRSISAIEPRTGGGYTVAGITQLTPTNFNDVELFVIQLDAAGAPIAYVVPDATGGPFRATTIDGEGVVVRLGTDRVRLDTIAGPVATFGTGGNVELPAGSGTLHAIFHAGDLVLARRDVTGGPVLRVTLVSRAGVIGATLDLPFDPGLSADAPLLASAPDGSLYVAGAIAHPMEAASLVKDDIDGSDFAVVRVVAGALDTSFGDAGVAHASFMLARNPIVLQTQLDRPLVLAIGADGKPWVSGLSMGIETMERAWLRRVTTRTAIVRFLQ